MVRTPRREVSRLYISHEEARPALAAAGFSMPQPSQGPAEKVCKYLNIFDAKRGVFKKWPGIAVRALCGKLLELLLVLPKHNG
jgi:hypothetical protein